MLIKQQTDIAFKIKISNNQLTNLLQKKRGTIDHLVRVETKEAFLRKEPLSAKFFDLKKVYETTWRYGIKKELHINLRRLTKFIDNFLTNKNIKVQVGFSLSDLYNLKERVP